MPPRPQSSKPAPWIQQRIKITCVVVEQVEATVQDALAIHKGKVAGTWAVTSVTTGRRLVTVKNNEDAVKIVEYLNLRCPVVFRLKTQDQIRKALPHWVESWLERCHKKGKFIPRE